MDNKKEGRESCTDKVGKEGGKGYVKESGRRWIKAGIGLREVIRIITLKGKKIGTGEGNGKRERGKGMEN